MDSSCTRRTWLAAAGGTALLAGCSSLPTPPEPAIDASPWAAQSAAPGSSRPWRHQPFPGKAPTQFKYAREDGRHAVSVTASSSASMLRRRLRIEPADLGSVVFSWKVPALIADADMASGESDDAPVRVMLVFDGDRSRFSARDAMLSELMRALTGEEMPYATLMYSWCSRREAGTVVTNARTSRVRTVVVESGPQKLNRWLDYRRNVRADFERAFGEPPGALVGVAIMSDSDNTRSLARAWYGPLHFLPPPAGGR
ncbi:MAG: DUF3047 domain-containing protein [Ramlibacter sp.]